MTVAVGAAAAAGVGTSSAPLGAAAASVAACDTDGFGFTRTLNGTNVASISVTSISTACTGGTLLLTAVGPGNAALATGSAAVNATTATVTLGSQPATSALVAYAVAITGP